MQAAEAIFTPCRGEANFELRGPYSGYEATMSVGEGLWDDMVTGGTFLRLLERARVIIERES